jgi:D-lactate dehydrogenase
VNQDRPEQGSIMDIPVPVWAGDSGPLGSTYGRGSRSGKRPRSSAQGATRGYDLRALVANHVPLRFHDVIVILHDTYDTDAAVGWIVDTTIGDNKAFAPGAHQHAVAGRLPR